MEQRTPEWFKARVGRVTGSIVGGILDCSPYQTRKSVMRQMVREYHGAESEFVGNPATIYGTNSEEYAKSDYTLEHGVTVVEEGFATYDDWLGASPDGMIGDKGMIEIKCPYGLRNDPNAVFKTAAEQPHYYGQMQIQLLCTGREWVDFYQWNPLGRCSLERITRDDIWLAKNLPVLKKFHKEYLEQIKSKNKESHLAPLKAVVIDEAADLLVQSIRDKKALMKALKDSIGLEMEALVELCENRDSTIGNASLIKVERKGSVNYKKIVDKFLPEVDASSYQGKETSYWKLT